MTPGWWRARETWTLLAIALVIRGACFWAYLHEHGLYGAWYGWGLDNGDTIGYFEPIESFLRGDAYRPDYRTPGYGSIYLLFRPFTTPQGAGTLVLFAQLGLSVISVVALARCAGLLGSGRNGRFAVATMYALFSSVSVYDIQWFTESFCTSALIFAVHGWLEHRRTGQAFFLVLSGAWMAWVVMLRPVQIIALLCIATGTFVLTDGGWRRRSRLVLLFALPFLLVDGWWVRRNLIMHGTITPLSPGTIPPDMARSPMYALMRYLQSTGGNYLYWDPSADIRWLNMRDGPLGRPGKRKDRDVHPPVFALSERVTLDSLRLLADDMEVWSRVSTTSDERNAIQRRMRARSDRYSRYFREDRPFAYHIGARIRMASLFFRRAGWMPLFHTPPRVPLWIARPLEALDRAFYIATLGIGMVAAVIALKRRRQTPERALIALVVLVSVLVIPLGLRLCEARYLVPMLPWLMTLSILAVEDRIITRTGG